MAKAASAKRKQKAKPKLKFSDKEQSERFIEAARKLGVEETDEVFEKAVIKVAASRSAKKD